MQNAFENYWPTDATDIGAESVAAEKFSVPRKFHKVPSSANPGVVYVLVRPPIMNPVKTIAPARKYPDYMYVDFPTVMKTSSGLAILISAFSLILTVVTGFSMIQPQIAVLIAIGGAFFYVEGIMMARGASGDRKSHTDS